MASKSPKNTTTSNWLSLDAAPAARFVQPGFYFVRQKGSHVVMRRNEPFAQVIVPEAKSLPPGTLRNIIKQANMTVAEFLELL